MYYAESYLITSHKIQKKTKFEFSDPSGLPSWDHKLRWGRRQAISARVETEH